MPEKAQEKGGEGALNKCSLPALWVWQEVWTADPVSKSAWPGWALKVSP